MRFTQGDLKAAQADYSRAIAINPAHAPAYFNRGIALRLRGDLEVSKIDLDRAVKLNPRLQDSIQMLAASGRENKRQTLEASPGNPP